MKKNAGLISVFVCVLMMFVCVTGAFAGGGQQQQVQGGGGKLRIAVVLKTLSSTYWQTVLSGAQKAAEELGVELIPLGPPTEDDAIAQTNMVEDVITQKVDAIVFSPCQPEGAITVLNKARDANVPVVVIDTPMPAAYTSAVTFIGSNNYQIGVLGAKEMLKNLKSGNKVLVLEGAPGNVAMTERADGAEKTFKDAGLTIVSRQPAYSDRERAYSITQNVLQTTDLDGVFAANDEQALGSYRAIVQAGKKAIVVGVDGNPDAKESVDKGELFATVAQSADQMGYLGVKYAVQYAKGDRNIDKKIDAPTPVYTKK
ncbi:MAG: sugar ABC transporter substrate-binding protein [Spirochaetaceae bacterium]|jgi:ribose transport system substrate-binding protein|nr:sugar ABC transporter substrate-binding protein [Spirochaetaceae bacterium]